MHHQLIHYFIGRHSLMAGLIIWRFEGRLFSTLTHLLKKDFVTFRPFFKKMQFFFIFFILKKDFRHSLLNTAADRWGLLRGRWGLLGVAGGVAGLQVLLNKLQLNITKFTNFRPKMAAFSLKTFRLFFNFAFSLFLLVISCDLLS